MWKNSNKIWVYWLLQRSDGLRGEINTRLCEKTYTLLYRPQFHPCNQKQLPVHRLPAHNSCRLHISIFLLMCDSMCVIARAADVHLNSSRALCSFESALSPGRLKKQTLPTSEASPQGRDPTAGCRASRARCLERHTIAPSRSFARCDPGRWPPTDGAEGEGPTAAPSSWRWGCPADRPPEAEEQRKQSKKRVQVNWLIGTRWMINVWNKTKNPSLAMLWLSLVLLQRVF